MGDWPANPLVSAIGRLAPGESHLALTLGAQGARLGAHDTGHPLSVHFEPLGVLLNDREQLEVAVDVVGVVRSGGSPERLDESVEKGIAELSKRCRGC